MKVHLIGLRPERRMDTNPGYIELLLEKREVMNYRGISKV